MTSHNAPSSLKTSQHDKITPMARVFGYVRVSTDMQATFGVSLDAQTAEIERYCAQQNFKLMHVYVDGGYSGGNTARPAFQDMMKSVQAGEIDAIVVTKLDRLTRSLRDLLAFNEDILEPYGVNLVAIKDGINTFEAVSKMLLPFLAIIGQIERQNTRERVKAAIAHIHSQGGHYGKVPFGSRPVRDGNLTRLEDHPEEKPWLDQIFAWYNEGKKLMEIARALNAAGVKPRSAETWSNQAVYEILCKHGVHKRRPVVSDFIYDRPKAYKIAYDLRSEERTIPYIVQRLTEEKLRPKNAAKYTVSSVNDLLSSAVYYDLATPRGYALKQKTLGKSLREICRLLLEAGHKPKRGGQWHAHQVKLLLAS